jgi:AcrR family transcriptional regulator
MSIIVPQLAAEDRRHTILKEVMDALKTTDTSITSIEAVIASTDVSPHEIVEHFASTQGLLFALMRMRSTSMLEPLDGCASNDEFRHKLRAFGYRVFDEYASAQLHGLYRIAVTEAIRNAAVGREIYKHGPGTVTSELARFINTAQRGGIASQAEGSHTLASHLLALLRTNLDLPDAVLVEASNDWSDEREEVSRIIDGFCAGIQTGAHHAHASV